MKSRPIRPIRAAPPEARHWPRGCQGADVEAGRGRGESPANIKARQHIKATSPGSPVTPVLPACARRRELMSANWRGGVGVGGRRVAETYHSRCSGRREKPVSTCPAAVGPPGYAVSASSARCLLGSLSSALGRRFNICLRLQARAPIPTFNAPSSLCGCSRLFCLPTPLMHEPLGRLEERRAHTLRLAAPRSYSNGC